MIEGKRGPSTRNLLCISATQQTVSRDLEHFARVGVNINVRGINGPD
jgi:hypothetical protein